MEWGEGVEMAEGVEMKKPDRWERIIQKEYKKWLKGSQDKGWLTIALKLLRQEHRGGEEDD